MAELNRMIDEDNKRIESMIQYDDATARAMLAVRVVWLESLSVFIKSLPSHPVESGWISSLDSVPDVWIQIALIAHWVPCLWWYNGKYTVFSYMEWDKYCETNTEVYWQPLPNPPSSNQ